MRFQLVPARARIERSRTNLGAERASKRRQLLLRGRRRL